MLFLTWFKVIILFCGCTTMLECNMPTCDPPVPKTHKRNKIRKPKWCDLHILVPGFSSLWCLSFNCQWFKVKRPTGAKTQSNAKWQPHKTCSYKSLCGLVYWHDIPHEVNTESKTFQEVEGNIEQAMHPTCLKGVPCKLPFWIASVSIHTNVPANEL